MLTNSSELNQLKGKRILLASASANRHKILAMSGIDWFEISPSEFAEDLDKAFFATSKDYVIATSEMKLKAKVMQVQSAMAQDKENGKEPVHMVITADTIVSLED